MSEDRAELAGEVSRLYWETDASIAEITDRLGISRRALYEALVPITAERACSSCGGELVYPNRSARMAGMAECRLCGRKEDLTLMRAFTAEAGSALRSTTEERSRSGPMAGPPPGTEPDLEQEANGGRLSPLTLARARRTDGPILLLLTAALAGFALGAMVMFLKSRR